MAEEVYSDTLYKAELEGSYTEDQLLDFLLAHNLWDENKQERLDTIQGQIEDFKVELFEASFRSEYRERIKRKLALIRTEQSKLLQQRHEYDHISAVGAATMAKARYLIAASLHTMDGKQIFDGESIWLAPDHVIEAAAEYISKNKATENIIRELARTEPWRTMWVSRKAESGVFGIPTVDLTDEQRMLSIWSSVYDSIYEHPECPEEGVINDDDMIDGWMIIQKRKRETERGNSGVDNLISNERIRNSEEIFLPADTVADARKIDTLNTGSASMIKKKRLALIKEKGIVKEADMPDSQMKMREELVRMYIEQRKG